MVMQRIGRECGWVLVGLVGLLACFVANTARAEAPQNSTDGRDVFLHQGISAEEAARAMTVPEGFSVQLCASEPQVRQPVAQAIDDRGRLWVAEFYTYPIRRPDDKANDRILILEDLDKDGRYEKTTVFYEGLNLLTGLEVGFGGVWVGAAPYLMFIPDRDGDDKPDGPPEILLDGFGYHDTHETLNSFIWGPDGWLYGCHGVFTHSNVGKPGTPADQRIPLNAAIWRYHPVRHEFEVFAHGTSNPWGFDFNETGDSFLTCCVIPHLFYVVQGGRYFRQAGRHFNPYTYDDIKTIAKHRHWTSGSPHSANGRSASAGGGHAHAGAMFYQGGSWPKEYRGKLFMNNIHGARLNVDVLTPEGSGYVGDRQPDFLLANDQWSQIINLQYGPDGQVIMIDWYDRIQCHQQRSEVDGSNGRIFRIAYQGAKPVTVDLAAKSNEELVGLLASENDWYVRHARRLLQERSAHGKVDAAIRAQLAAIAQRDAPLPQRLRALWALHSTGGLSEEMIRAGLGDPDARFRAWTIQLALEEHPAGTWLLEKMASMAHRDPSPVVRLYLASALQRLEPDQRWEIAAGLVSHGEDATDHNLPLMDWYGIEPLGALDPSRALHLVMNGKIPLLQSFMVRRIAAVRSAPAMAAIMTTLKEQQTNEGKKRILRALQLAFEGERQQPLPSGWSELSTNLRQSDDGEIRSLATSLGLIFGDQSAMAALRTVLADPKQPLPRRREALRSLVAARDAKLGPWLLASLKHPELGGECLDALAVIVTPETPGELLALYRDNPPGTDRRRILNVLTSRKEWGHLVLDQVAAGQVASSDLTADLVRQLRNLDDPTLAAKITEVWGSVRDTPLERQKLIDGYREMLMKKPSSAPDLGHGRAIFVKTCAQCHTLFGTGGKVGPELTGANRGDLEYILSNVLDPSALMAKDYQPTKFLTEDGRVLLGIIKDESQGTYTIATANETIRLPKDEIEEMKLDTLSMMPDDLWKPLSESDVRALVAYLASPAQVACLLNKDNAAQFFNGRDLAGWKPTSGAWTVSNSVLTGLSPGDHPATLIADMAAQDFEIQFDYLLSPHAQAALLINAQPTANAPGLDTKSGLAVLLGGDKRGTLTPQGQHDILESSGTNPSDWTQARIRVRKRVIEVSLNGQPVWQSAIDPKMTRGLFAFRLAGTPTVSAEIEIKNLTIRPVE